MDYVYGQWNGRPVSFVSYGGVSGGIRAVEQLRQVAIELQMFPLRESVHIPLYWNYLTEKGELKTDSFQDSANKMLNQIVYWSKGLKELREK